MKGILILFSLLFILGFVSSTTGGCCYDPASGFCSKNSQALCAGTWSSDPTCSSLSECTSGCCILGSSTKYITRKTCDSLARSLGFEFQWNDGITESDCSARGSSEKMGACVYKRDYLNDCKFVSKGKCSSSGGTFYDGVLCTAPELNTHCQKTQNTKTIEDKDEVYYTDSCGNIANIYDSTKYNNAEYWKRVFSKNESCGAGQSNANSKTCGNCDYSLGSLGRLVEGVLNTPDHGKYICADLNCYGPEIDGYYHQFGIRASLFVPGKGVFVGSDLVEPLPTMRKNGESWCYYDLAVKDENTGLPDDSWLPGSRFYRKFCMDGKVYIEPCENFREEFCDAGQCIKNDYMACFEGTDEGSCPNQQSSKDHGCGFGQAPDCVWIPDAGGGITTFCGSNRDSYGQFIAEGKHDPTKTGGEFVSNLLADLGFDMCSPWLSPGSTETCSYGSVELTATFKRDGSWYIQAGGATEETLPMGSSGLNLQKADLGRAGLFDLNPDHWYFTGGGFFPIPSAVTPSRTTAEGTVTDIPSGSFRLHCTEENAVSGDDDGCYAVERIYESGSGTLPLDGKVLTLLNQRCRRLGDCDGESNYQLLPGGADGSGGKMSCKKSGEKTVTCTFKYECKPRVAASGGDKCGLCNGAAMPCDEYKCNSLGKACEYKELQGIETGYCYSSSDGKPPEISHSMSPVSPIPPFQPVLFILTTDEESYCKFGFSSGGPEVGNMPHETSRVWGREHSFVLNLPGRARFDEEINEYNLLTRDGKYKLFVRCEDPAGNVNVNPYTIDFEVMDTPDGVPPEVLQFIPPTGSYAKFNTTEKQIRFKISEPAECKWSFEDQSFSEMNNSFECDLTSSVSGSLDGYYCSGTLTNVTLTIGNSTKYFVRCKDQPSLEGKEDRLYKRNENTRSFEYVLRPSLALEISGISPAAGNFIVGGSVGNITYEVKTKDGAERGKAECKWRLRSGEYNSSWMLFGKTNSSTHQQVLTGLNSSEYFVDVKCEDIAGNKVNSSSQLNILVDSTPPVLTRAYNDRGSLKVFISEEGSCKFANKGSCSSVNTNGSLMNSREIFEHVTSLKKGAPFYIRCQDYFGNSRCFDTLVFY